MVDFLLIDGEVHGRIALLGVIGVMMKRKIFYIYSVIVLMLDKSGENYYQKRFIFTFFLLESKKG